MELKYIIVDWKDDMLNHNLILIINQSSNLY